MKLATLITVGVGLLVGCGVPVVIGGFVGIALFGAWRARRRALGYAAAAYQLPVAPPARPPVEAWAAGAWGLWCGAEDSGTWDGDRARQSLDSWYGAGDGAALRAVVDGLAEGQTGNLAWDCVRAIDLLRIGVAAGYLTADECWDSVRKLATALRREHATWDELATAFEAGMHEWQDSRGVGDEEQRGRVRRNRPYLASVVWPTIAWEAAL